MAESKLPRSYFKQLQGECFASDRESMASDTAGKPFVDKYERLGSGPYCYVLKEMSFKHMYESGRCGNKGCPFYKKTRAEIRKD